MPFPLAIPAAGKIAGMIGIKGFIIAGLGALCLLLALNTYLKIDFLFIHIEGWKPRAERMESQWKSAEDRLKVSNGSIDRLTATIADLNAEALKRAEAFEDSRKMAVEDAQRLEREARRTQGQIDRLRALAAAGGTCEVPGELADALGGL